MQYLLNKCARLFQITATQQRKLDQPFPIHLLSIHRFRLRDYVSNRSTHWARDEGATNGSAKYCVSRVTLSPLNSMMLTV
jgi:hypothetical protein